MENLVVNKREEIACWKVDCEGICPNTEISLESGLTLLVKVEGAEKISAKSNFTIHSLLNPGKTTKLFGGKKPYSKCEIYAVDISSSFASEWGIAGDHALSCRDDEFDVDAKAVAFGEYSYTVKNYFAFLSCFPLSTKKEITRADVREYLRSETVSVVAPYLSSRVGAGVAAVQSRLFEFSEDIRFHLNEHFGRKGIEVVSFGITRFDYSPAHQANREALKNAKMGVKIKGVENVGRRDDLTVTREEADIAIDIINAQNGIAKNKKSGGSDDKKPSEKKIYCSRCGEANSESSRFCSKCGEKLHK